MIRMVIAAVSVLFICVFVALLVKCFAIDLALLLRPYLPLRSHREVHPTTLCSNQVATHWFMNCLKFSIAPCTIHRRSHIWT